MQPQVVQSQPPVAPEYLQQQSPQLPPQVQIEQPPVVAGIPVPTGTQTGDVAAIEQCKAAAEVPPKKRGRGRPSKKEMEERAKAAELALEAQTAQRQAAEQPAKAQPTLETPQTQLGTAPTTLKNTLYINAMPTRGQHCVDLLEFTCTKQAAQQVCTAAKVAHWSLVDYGKGPGAFAACFAQQLQAFPSDHTLHIRVRTESSEFRALESVLRNWATVIIESVR